MRILTLIFVFVLCGCKTIEKQRRQANAFFDAHLGELATRCDKQFPVKDSIGDLIIDSVRNASNMNYSRQLDSLVAIGDNAIIQLLYAKKRADSISEQCADVVLGYMRDVERLQQNIKSIKSSYKPCDPDTLMATRLIYRRSTAREVSLRDSLDQILYQLSQMTDQSNQQIKELSDKDSAISRLNSEKGSWMRKAIGTWIGLILLIGGALYYRIKK